MDRSDVSTVRHATKHFATYLDCLLGLERRLLDAVGNVALALDLVLELRCELACLLGASRELLFEQSTSVRMLLLEALALVLTLEVASLELCALALECSSSCLCCCERYSGLCGALLCVEQLCVVEPFGFASWLWRCWSSLDTMTAALDRVSTRGIVIRTRRRPRT